MLMTFISLSGAHFVINRAWALHHKLGQSELLTDPQLRHPDDSVEGQLWERKQGHEDTKSQVPEYASATCDERRPPLAGWGTGSTYHVRGRLTLCARRCLRLE